MIVDFSVSAGSRMCILKNDNLEVMQFRVAAKGPRDESALPQTLRPVPKIPESSAVKTRMLSLVEIDRISYNAR